MGFYTGVLVILPAAILMHLMFEGFSGSSFLCLHLDLVHGVAWDVCAGAIAGAINRKS